MEPRLCGGALLCRDTAAARRSLNDERPATRGANGTRAFLGKVIRRRGAANTAEPEGSARTRRTRPPPRRAAACARPANPGLPGCWHAGDESAGPADSCPHSELTARDRRQEQQRLEPVKGERPSPTVGGVTPTGRRGDRAPANPLGRRSESRCIVLGQPNLGDAHCSATLSSTGLRDPIHQALIHHRSEARHRTTDQAKATARSS